MQIRSVRELAAVVRERRRRLGWTQEELARQAGVGRDWVLNFERGKPGVELALVLRTLKALSIPVHLGDATERPEAGSGGMLEGLLAARRKGSPL